MFPFFNYRYEAVTFVNHRESFEEEADGRGKISENGLHVTRKGGVTLLREIVRATGTDFAKNACARDVVKKTNQVYVSDKGKESSCTGEIPTTVGKINAFSAAPQKGSRQEKSTKVYVSDKGNYWSCAGEIPTSVGKINAFSVSAQKGSRQGKKDPEKRREKRPRQERKRGSSQEMKGIKSQTFYNTAHYGRQLRRFKKETAGTKGQHFLVKVKNRSLHTNLKIKNKDLMD